MNPLRIILLTLAMALLSLGCERNEITGRKQLQTITDEEAAQLSAKAYARVLAEAGHGRALDISPTAQRRVRAITDLLVAQAAQLRPESRHWAWEVHVIDSEEVNAWCMAGGKMALYGGLLRTLRPTDDEIAQVMSHEIAHALLSHQSERMSRVQVQQTGVKLGVLLGALAGHDLRGLAGLTDAVATVGLQLPNSRAAEAEADKVGIELAARAGFAPSAAITLWEKMLRLEKDRLPAWLSTHPSPRTRLASIREAATAQEPTYLAARRKR